MEPLALNPCEGRPAHPTKNCPPCHILPRNQRPPALHIVNDTIGFLFKDSVKDVLLAERNTEVGRIRLVPPSWGDCVTLFVSVPCVVHGYQARHQSEPRDIRIVFEYEVRGGYDRILHL